MKPKRWVLRKLSIEELNWIDDNTLINFSYPLALLVLLPHAVLYTSDVIITACCENGNLFSPQPYVAAKVYNESDSLDIITMLSMVTSQDGLANFDIAVPS